MTIILVNRASGYGPVPRDRTADECLTSTTHLVLSSDGAPAEVGDVHAGGGVVAVADGATVQLFDDGGRRLQGSLGGTTGAVSADGAVYAYAPSAAERDGGMRGGLARLDVDPDQAGDASRRTPLPAAAIELAWFDGEVYAVTADAAGGRRLWRCVTTCEELLADSSGTLTLS